LYALKNAKKCRLFVSKDFVLQVRVKFFLSFILCVSFVQVWGQTGHQSDAELPTVKVAMSDDHSIVIQRLLYTALRRSGYQMVANVTGMRTAVADVNYGDAVVLPTQTDGWERLYPNLIKVPISIDNVEYTAYARSDSNYQFRQWSDMAGLRVRYRWQNEFVANNIWRAGASSAIAENDLGQLWASLVDGKADVIILPRMSHFEYRFPYGVRRAGVIERQPVYTYVNSRHRYLVPLLENAYREMIQDGTFATIINSRFPKNEKPIILHINSYNAQNEWERNQMELIRSSLDADNVFEYFSYFLNSNEIHSRASFTGIVSDMIRTGFISHQPDLLIVSGNEALDYILNNYHFLFPNLPVIFFGVQGLDRNILYGLEANFTGISQSISFNETVSGMLSFFPRTKRIFILNDHSHTKSINLLEAINENINESDLPVEYIISENKPFADILNDIRALDSETLVLIGNYLGDSNGISYSETEVQSLVSLASINPVFCLTSSYMGSGTFGALISAREEQSKTVAEMASEIINGKSPYLIPIIHNSASINQWQFDYKAAKRFNINLKRLPKGHVVINRSIPIWESNPLEFNLLITIAVLLIMIIFGLIVFIRINAKRQADKNMHLLLDTLPMCCQLINKNGKIVDCNKAGMDMYGFTDKTEYMENFFRLCTPEKQPDGKHSEPVAYELISKAFEDGYYRTEWMHNHLNGEPRPCDVILIRIAHPKEGYILAAYMRDLREHKKFVEDIEKVQEDLRHARDAAESANRTKSTFLANMSHEIRTPMNSIIGFAELAQYSENQQKTNEYLSNISQSAEWLLKIINDILDISKIESGKIVLEHIPFDLHDMLEYCQMTIKPKLEEKGIGLYFYAEPTINGKLVGDPIRLRQVLINLLSNAVKFTNSGLVKLLVALVDTKEDKVTIHFEVKDSGIGMSPEQISKITEPFTQADSSVTRRFGGTGLGLSITKNIIELMGGELKVESVLSVGSKFSFEVTFDLLDDNASDAVIPDNMIFDIDKPNFSGEVLICEDNLMNQQVICDHLSRVGLNAMIAHNGREGVTRAKERMDKNNKPFDLIFMDIHMPEMDGLEAASRISEMGVKTPIVALTANIMSNDIELYKKNGMCDCLGKPFTSQELWKCLSKYIRVISFSKLDKNEYGKEGNEEEKKFQKQMQTNFVRNNQSTFDQFEKAVNDNDIKLAHRIAHTLKSNAGLIGKNKLQAVAAALESMLAEGINPLEKEEFAILEREMKTVLEELAPLLAEMEAKRPAKINDAKKILEIFEKLEPMLQNKNPECEELMDDVFSIPGAEDLAGYMDKFDFKQAIAEMTKLKKRWEKKDAE